MKISYAITVCNEIEEIKNLVPFILERKRIEDEIIILFDEKNGSKEVLDFLLPFNIKPGVQTWRHIGFKNDFAEWKNRLNSHCSGDYIFQIDADEMISEDLINDLPNIIELNPETDLFYIPRINLVEGITLEHIRNWKWNIDNKMRINFPDYQGRIYKSKLKWEGKVHERIVGAKFYSLLPVDNEEYFIQHNKTITRQEKQNNFYNTL